MCDGDEGRKVCDGEDGGKVCDGLMEIDKY